MGKLIQKVNWDLPGSPSQQLYMYGEASVEVNQAMQEPLQKLYEYENKPDMREKIREYVGELNYEIKGCEDMIKSSLVNESQLYARLDAFVEIRNDLQSRLDEVI